MTVSDGEDVPMRRNCENIFTARAGLEMEAELFFFKQDSDRRANIGKVTKISERSFECIIEVSKTDCYRRAWRWDFMPENEIGLEYIYPSQAIVGSISSTKVVYRKDGNSWIKCKKQPIFADSYNTSPEKFLRGSKEYNAFEKILKASQKRKN